MMKTVAMGLMTSLLLGVGPTPVVYAAGLDWEVEESPNPSAAARVARNVRDGVLTFVDAFLDANTAAFGEAAMLLAKLAMGLSDGVGLIDDNGVTQHITKGVVSKALAKTAYLWHTAGAESVLGGHGFEVERWAADEVAQLNPLLGQEDRDEIAGPLPLDPLEFVGEGWVHTEVYRTHSTLLGIGSVLLCDGVMRPTAGLLRVLQLRSVGDSIERAGNDLVSSAARVRW